MKAYVLEWGTHRLELGRRTQVMGILNVTPDSFSDGGKFYQVEEAVARGVEMAAAGADIIDIGGESTRPYSEAISPEAEMQRVVPVIETLAKKSVPLSIDTTKAEVARQALECGAEMINDVSALSFDPEMAPLCARYGAAVILMHMRGTPLTMQRQAAYGDLLTEVTGYLKNRIAYALRGGISPSCLAIDPGIGFGKSVADNLRLLNHLEVLEPLGRPVVVGTSRKSFIGKTLKCEVDERLEGTAATVALGIARGAHIVRVHDVASMRMVADMSDAVVAG